TSPTAQENLTEPSQELPMDRIEPNEEPSTTPPSEEWQIFNKLKDAEGRVPQKLFHEALESSGKFVVEDIAEIIEDMNLESICIEMDDQFIDCYRKYEY